LAELVWSEVEVNEADVLRHTLVVLLEVVVQLQNELRKQFWKKSFFKLKPN
jgi:hypothetical protein